MSKINNSAIMNKSAENPATTQILTVGGSICFISYYLKSASIIR